MTEKPIQFPALHADAMIQAILDQRKTQHRVPVHPQPPDGATPIYDPLDCYKGEGWAFQYTEQAGVCAGFDLSMNRIFPLANRGRSPFGGPGDRLSVRECYLPRRSRDGLTHVTAYRADGYELESGEQWVPSTNMPRDASRIMQEVCEVRVQQVQDISEEDISAEGIDEIVVPGTVWAGDSHPVPLDTEITKRERFMYAWDTIYAPKGLGWSENPWVWAGTFKRIEG